MEALATTLHLVPNLQLQVVQEGLVLVVIQTLPVLLEVLLVVAVLGQLLMGVLVVLQQLKKEMQAEIVFLVFLL